MRSFAQKTCSVPIARREGDDDDPKPVQHVGIGVSRRGDGGERYVRTGAAVSSERYGEEKGD